MQSARIASVRMRTRRRRRTLRRAHRIRFVFSLPFSAHSTHTHTDAILIPYSFMTPQHCTCAPPSNILSTIPPCFFCLRTHSHPDLLHYNIYVGTNKRGTVHWIVCDRIHFTRRKLCV